MRNHLIRYLTMLLMLICGFSTSWATTTVSFSYSDFGGKLTATKDGVTVTFSSGSTGQEYMRFYANATLTISSTSNKINEVHLNDAGDSKTFSESYFTFTPASTGNTNVTSTTLDWTGLNVNQCSVKTTTQVRFKTINVVIADASGVSAPTSVTFAPTSGSTVSVGDKIELSSTGATSIYYKKGNASDYTLYNSTDKIEVLSTDASPLTITAYASNAGGNSTTFTATYTINTGTSGGGGTGSTGVGSTYTLVTNAGDLSDGDKVILAAKKDSKWTALALTSDVKDGIAATDVADTETDLVQSGDISIFTIKASGDSDYPFQLYFDKANKYIGNNGNSNALNSVTESNRNNNGYYLKYDPNETNNTIKSNGNNSNARVYFKLNGSYTRFYDSSQTYPGFYIFKEAGPALTTAVITVDPTSLTLIEGATGTITASVNSGATLSFSSDNQNVIVVENDGSYLAGDAGTATITISAPATSAYTAASVEIPVTVTSDGWLKYTDALYSADGETWNAVADLTGDPVSNFKYIKWEGCPIMLKYESGVQPSLQSGNLAWLSKALFSVYTTDPNVVAITGFAMDPAGTTASNIGTWADGVWTAPDGVNVRSFNVVNAATGSGSQIKPTKFKFEYTTGSAVIPAEPENYVTDHLTSASFDATTTSQKGFTGADTNKDSNIKSTAVYAGKTGKGSNDEVYLNQSGFGTTASGGKVRKVALNWASGSAIDRVISVYGSNEAITNVSEMTPIATIAFANAQTEAVITDDYAHIYIAGDGSTSALLGYIDITWEPAAPAAQAPVFKIGETVVTEDMTVRKGSEVTITSENAELIGYQLTVGENTTSDFIEPGESVTITSDCTLKAWGVNADEENGEPTEYSFTILKPVAAIIFNPASGASITKGGYVTISCADAEQISYYLNSDELVIKDVDSNHSIQVQLNTVGEAELLATALIAGVEGSNGYAEYTVTEPTYVVDHLVPGDFSATSNQYAPTNNLKHTASNGINSDAIYEGNTATQYSAIQINSKSNANQSIWTTTSGGYVRKVSVDWNTNTSSDRQVDIYVSNSPINSENWGTKQGSINHNNSETEYSITGNYEYVRIATSTKGAVFLDAVDITWEEVPVEAPTVAPTFSPAGGNVDRGTVVTITAVAPATKLEYTTDGGTTWVEADALTQQYTINGVGGQQVTLQARASNKAGSVLSEVQTYTINAAATAGIPTFTIGSDAVSGNTSVNKGTTVSLNVSNASVIKYTITKNGVTSEPVTTTAPVSVTIDDDMTITASGVNADNVEGNSVSITFTLNRPGAVSFTPASGAELEYKSTVTITCADAEQIAYSINGGETVTVTGTTTTTPELKTADVSIVAWGLISGAEGEPSTATYSVTVPDKLTYKLVTNQDEIVDGQQYIIVDNQVRYAMGKITSNNAYTGIVNIGSLSVGDDKGIIELDPTEDYYDDLVKVILENKGTDIWALKLVSDDENINDMYLKSSSNSLSYVDSSTSSNGTQVSISVNDDANLSVSPVKVNSTTINYGDSEILYYNANRFKTYGNPQTGIALYALVDLSKVQTPRLIITEGTADEGGYYNNAITLKASCATSGAAIKYSTDYSESNPTAATWQTVPADPWILNEPCNIVLKAEKEGLDDSDVSSTMVFKFRPAAPVITVADGLSISKKVTITPSTTEGAVTEVQNGDGTWQEITAPMTIVVTENGAVNARATKTGYNPNTVTTSYNVEVTYDGTEEETHTYDTCTGGATSLTKPWTSNNSYSNINGVEWYLNAENGADVYLGTNYGQIGKASDKEDGIYAVSYVEVTTDQIPGVISKVILYVSGTNDTEGGTYTVKIGGNVYGTGSYGTSSNAIEVNGGLAEGPVELIFHNTNPGAFNFSRVQIDYTPVADLTKVRTPRISLPSGEYTIDTEVEITCGTPGARIYYTTDGTVPTEASTQYTGRIVLEDDITLTARAFKSGLEPSNVASAVYTVIEADIYELITAGTKLEEGDEIIVVNNIPMTSETVKSGQSGTLNWTDPAWFAMGYEKYVDSKGTVKDYYTGIPLQEVTNGDPDRPRQLMATSDMKIARFTLAPLPNGESSGANNNKWLLQCGTTEIDDPENPGEKITVPTYVESVVKIVQSGGKNKEVYTLNFVPLPDNAVDRTRLKATLSVMSTTTENEKDFAIYHQNGSQYNCSNTDKDNVYDKGIITFSGVNNNEVFTTTFRFNPTTAYHFNGYGYTATETGNDLHDSTWPVSFYRSTDRLYRPSITVYSQKVTMENYNEPTEYETKPLGEDVYPFYNAVKVVVKEHPRTQRGAILAYHWAKTEDDVPVAEEYDEIEGSEVKGADMTVYVDGFDMLYYDVDNVEYRLPNYFSDENLSNSDDFMEAVLFSISELEGVNSPNTHRKFKFKTTAPDIEKTTVDGQKGIYIKRPEVFTKGAVIYYTTNGVTEPEVTWTYNEGEKKWEASPANANVRGPWTPGAFMEIADGQTVKVGAFKHGYEPAIATVSNLTVMPYARPIQLLELSADGLAQIKDGSSETTKAEIDGLKSGEQVYLTYRPASVDDNDNPKYYVLQNYITIVDNKEKEVITIIDVNNDAAKAVINNPHLFKWTADYYVFGMRLDEFVSQLNGGSYDETTARMYVHDGSHEARVIPTEFNLNEDDEFADPQPVTYYGSILRRKGSLGTNYLWTEFKYDAKEAGAADYTHYETSRVTQVTPEIPAPFELRYHYESVRDESSLYDREDDYVFVDDTYSSIPGIVTAMKNGAMEKNTLKFRKEDFTLRHLDCVFTFHRPNVCDDIIDNYDIVYDVEVKTGEDLPDLRHRYVDPTKAADIKKIEADALAEAQAAGKTLTKEQIHDIVNRYEFRVNNVHPATDIFPTLVIHGVNYYPNGENEGYSELNANYTGDESEAMDEFYGVVDLDGKTVQEVQAPNLSSAAEMTVDVEVAYDLEKDEFGGVTGKYNWEIANHKEVRNGDVHAHNYTPVVAPFMYHIEGAYFEKKNNVENENDVENENVTPEKYFSYEYLICHEAGTDPEGCGTQGVEGEDPFFKIPVGKGYEAGTVPTIFITPMYFFERMPEPSVTEESALVEYDIHYADNNKTNAPKKVMRRAGETDADNPDADQPQIIVVRGKNAYSLRAEKSVMTGIDGMGAEGIVQQGNNLILPQGAKLYDTSGLQMRPEGLPHGIYLVRLADGRTVKVAVK